VDLSRREPRSCRRRIRAGHHRHPRAVAAASGIAAQRAAQVTLGAAPLLPRGSRGRAAGAKAPGCRQAAGPRRLEGDGRCLPAHDRTGSLLATRRAAEETGRARTSEQVNAMHKLKLSILVWMCGCLGSAIAVAQPIAEIPLGQTVERHLSSDEPVTEWVQDPA